MSDLPENWCICKMSEIVLWTSGGTPKATDKSYYENGEIPWLVIGDLSDGQVFCSEKCITQKAVKESSAKLIPPGTLLLGMYGSIGKLGITQMWSATNQAIASAISLEGIRVYYLFYWLKYIRSKLFALGKGGTQKNISLAVINSLEIPLPPLAEQGRIVQKIEELFADIDAGIQNLKSVQDQIKLYRQSVLKSAFEGKLTTEWREANLPAKIKNDLAVENPPFYIPSNWAWFKLPQIGTVERGKSKHRPRNDKRLFGGKYPFIQTGEIKASKQYLYNYSETYSDFGLSQSKLWDENTLCITIAANIAETAILKIKACFPDSVVGFTKNDQISRIEYVEYYIRLIRENLDKAAPATAQKNINLQTLSEVLIPLPTLDEQERIVAEIERRFERADELEQVVADTLADTEKMKQTILKKAFRGELVEQNPDDEPAAVLLDRIRAERASAPKSSKKGKRK